MKIVFFSLLLINVLVFIWQYPQSSQSVTVSSSAVPSESVPRLQLVSELVAEIPDQNNGQANGQSDEADKGIQSVQPPLPSPVVVAPPPVVANVCYTIGPYSERVQADKALAWMTQQGWSGQRNELSDKTLVGFRVLMPQQLNQVSAQSLVSRLKKQGVKDVAILLDEGRHIISLGFFSKRSSVERRQSEMKRLGYDVQVSPSYRQRVEYWLNMERGADGDAHATIMTYLKKSVKTIGSKKTKCR